jgi:uncharacterized protein
MEFPKYFVVFMLLSLMAEVMGTVGGFGSSAFFVPVANFFLDFKFVLGITAIFHLSSNISKLFLFRNGLDWKLLLRFGVPGVIGVVVGGFLSAIVPEVFLTQGLGIFLIVMSVILLIWRKLKLAPTTPNAVAGGTLSGFMAGIVGTGGAIRGLTLAAFSLEKDVFIATSAAIDLGIDASRSVVYFANGYITKESLIYIPFLLVIGLLGSWIGKKILERISNETFRTIVLLSLMGIGVLMLLNLKAG